MQLLVAHNATSAACVRRLQQAWRPSQCLVVATLALLVGSLATIAVPKLAGSLIDVCIQYNQEGGRDAAKHHLNTMLYQILGILAVGGVATGIRSWWACDYVKHRNARNWGSEPLTSDELGQSWGAYGCFSLECTCGLFHIVL